MILSIFFSDEENVSGWLKWFFCLFVSLKKNENLQTLLCFDSVIFFPLQLLCLATLLENAVIHWSESPLVTSLKILLEIHLKDLQSSTSFLRSEHLLIKHCHRVPREKTYYQKMNAGFYVTWLEIPRHQFSKQGENLRVFECFLLKLWQAVPRHCWGYLSM